MGLDSRSLAMVAWIAATGTFGLILKEQVGKWTGSRSKPISLRTLHRFPVKGRPKYRELSSDEQGLVDQRFDETEITVKGEIFSID